MNSLLYIANFLKRCTLKRCLWHYRVIFAYFSFLIFVSDMTDRKGSAKDNNRIEQVLEESRPFYMIALSAFFTVFFLVYDALVFLPFKILADPEKKRALSQREKAKPTVEDDPSSPWRHVDTINKPLQTRIFDDCYTLGALWDRSVE